MHPARTWLESQATSQAYAVHTSHVQFEVASSVFFGRCRSSGAVVHMMSEHSKRKQQQALQSTSVVVSQQSSTANSSVAGGGSNTRHMSGDDSVHFSLHKTSTLQQRQLTQPLEVRCEIDRYVWESLAFMLHFIMLDQALLAATIEARRQQQIKPNSQICGSFIPPPVHTSVRNNIQATLKSLEADQLLQWQYPQHQW